MWVFPVYCAEVGKICFMSNPKSFQEGVCFFVCSKFQHGNKLYYLLHLVLKHWKLSRDLADLCSKESICGRMTKPSKSRGQRQSIQSSALVLPLFLSDVLPCISLFECTPFQLYTINTSLYPQSFRQWFHYVELVVLNTEEFPQLSQHSKSSRDSRTLGENTAQAKQKQLCSLFSTRFFCPSGLIQVF